MLRWAATFFIIAIIAALLGFTGGSWSRGEHCRVSILSVRRHLRDSVALRAFCGPEAIAINSARHAGLSTAWSRPTRRPKYSGKHSLSEAVRREWLPLVPVNLSYAARAFAGSGCCKPRSATTSSRVSGFHVPNNACASFSVFSFWAWMAACASLSAVSSSRLISDSASCFSGS